MFSMSILEIKKLLLINHTKIYFLVYRYLKIILHYLHVVIKVFQTYSFLTQLYGLYPLINI